MNAFRTLFKDILSGPGNAYFDMGRLLWGTSVLSMLAFQAYSIAKGQNFDPVAFGAGTTGLLVGGGGGVALKDRAQKKTVVSGDLNAENIESVEVKP